MKTVYAFHISHEEVGVYVDERKLIDVIEFINTNVDIETAQCIFAHMKNPIETMQEYLSNKSRFHGALL